MGKGSVPNYPKRDMKEVRTRSTNMALAMGYSVSNALPLLDDDLRLRPVEAIISRVLCLNCVIAAAHGFSTNRARAWLDRERLLSELTTNETQRLLHDDIKCEDFWVQAEAVWALVWTLGMVTTMDFSQNCSEHLVDLMPDLRKNETSGAFRKRVCLIDLREIVAACDLAYCLHWSVVQARLDGQPVPGKVEEYVIVERRRALEWALSDFDWDDVPLDT